MEGLRELRAIDASLSQIPLPGVGDCVAIDSDEDMLRREVRAFTCAAICHLRALLRATILAAELTNLPVLFVLSRSVFEWGAYTWYLHQRVHDYERCQSIAQLRSLFAGLQSIGLSENVGDLKGDDSGDAATVGITQIAFAYDYCCDHSREDLPAQHAYSFLIENTSPSEWSCHRHYYSPDGPLCVGDLQQRSPLAAVLSALKTFAVSAVALLLYADDRSTARQLESVVALLRRGEMRIVSQDGKPQNGIASQTRDRRRSRTRKKIVNTFLEG